MTSSISTKILQIILFHAQPLSISLTEQEWALPQRFGTVKPLPTCRGKVGRTSQTKMFGCFANCSGVSSPLFPACHRYCRMAGKAGGHPTTICRSEENPADCEAVVSHQPPPLCTVEPSFVTPRLDCPCLPRWHGNHNGRPLAGSLLEIRP